MVASDHLSAGNLKGICFHQLSPLTRPEPFLSSTRTTEEYAMKLTDKERRVWRAICTNDYWNGRIGDGAIWANGINDAAEPSGITGRALSALVKSLVAEGLIESQGRGRDAVIMITERGMRQLRDSSHSNH